MHIPDGFLSPQTYLPAYALAVSEENAMGHEIVTAPTCGSCGVLPGVLRVLGCRLGRQESGQV